MIEGKGEPTCVQRMVGTPGGRRGHSRKSGDGKSREVISRRSSQIVEGMADSLPELPQSENRGEL